MEHMESVGYEGTCELLAILYIGREREDDFQFRFEAVKKGFPTWEDAASQIAGKSPALAYIGSGLAILAGLLPPEASDDDEESL